MDARRRYAVLCPLAERPEGLSFIFETRAAGLNRQPGETCFPGGRARPGESAPDCALRETWEELAIPLEHIRLLGTPDFLLTQAGDLIQPVIGLVDAAGAAALRPAPAETAEAFFVPAEFFRSTPPELCAYELKAAVPEDFPYESVGIGRDYPWARGRVEVPVWHFGGRAIWGITARIIRAVLEETDWAAERG
jgi:coenzyme A diphosphatase NUDT7